MTSLGHLFHIGVWNLSCLTHPTQTHNQTPKLGPKHLPTPQYRDILEWIPATLIPFLVFCFDGLGKLLPNNQPKKKVSGRGGAPPSVPCVVSLIGLTPEPQDTSRC